MTKDQKQEVIEVLKDKFSQYSNFYITDTESLSVSQVTALRRTCFDKQVEMKVAKNTLIKKALESLDSEKYSGVYESLHNVTALMFSESPKDPAVIISSFRKSNNNEKPVLKAAFLNGEIYIGDNNLINLTKIKTKNELIGDVIGLLLSPIQRVVGALQNKPENAGNTGTQGEKTMEATASAATTAPAEAEAPKTSEAQQPEAKTESEKPAEADQSEAKADVEKPAEAPDAKGENPEAQS